MEDLISDERIVLEAMYGDDFQLSGGAWGKSVVFIIRLCGAIQVQYVIGKNYPAEVPRISLQPLPQSVGNKSPFSLSSKDFDSMQVEVQSIAEQHRGQPMVSECTMALERCLKLIKDRPPPKDLFQAMLQRQSLEDNALQKLRAVGLSESAADGEFSSSSGNGKSWAARVTESAAVQSVVEKPKPTESVLFGPSVQEKSWIAAFVEQLEAKAREREDEVDGSDQVVESARDKSKSRFQIEFEELHVLGRGASGVVVKAKHRLDSSLYAVKKIFLGRKPIDQRIRREVLLISSVSHNSIVRYQSAWVEESTECDEAGSGTGAGKGSSLEETSSLGGLGGALFLNRWKRGGIGACLGSESDEDEEDDNVYWEREDGDAAEAAAESSSASSLPVAVSLVGTGAVDDDGIEKTLFIQMEYCPTTLRTLIDSGTLYKNPDGIWSLLRQILLGLEYIHSRRILHRDLKPANIFIGADGSAKLGDFGLAKLGGDEQSKAQISHARESRNKARSVGLSFSDSANDAGSELTQGIGTTLYRAPEQESGESYDQKADVYSVGVCLFEMCMPPFSTGMERVQTIRSLREKSVLPVNFSDTASSSLAECILWMTKLSASERPSASELLKSKLIPVSINLEEVNQAIRGSHGVSSGILSSLFSSDTPSLFQKESYNLAATDALLQQLIAFDASGGRDGRDSSSQQQQLKTNALAIRNKICDVVQQIFITHGAVAFSPPLLQLRSSRRQDVGQCEFLDRQGKVVVLPATHLDAVACSIGVLNVSSCSAFHFGEVFVQNSASIEPRPTREAVFVSVNDGCRVEALTEVLQAALRIAHQLRPVLPSRCIVRVTDSRLLDAIIHVCAISAIATSEDPETKFKIPCQEFFESAAGSVSLSAEGEIISLGDRLGIPLAIVRRLVPFYRCLSLSHGQGTANVVALLSTLERIFFDTDAITQLKRHQAQPSESLDDGQVFQKSLSSPVSPPTQSPLVVVGPAKETQARELKDFMGLIGKKRAATPGDSSKASLSTAQTSTRNNNPAPDSPGLLHQQHSSQQSGQGIYSRKQLKTLLKHVVGFERSVSFLKETFASLGSVDDLRIIRLDLGLALDGSGSGIFGPTYFSVESQPVEDIAFPSSSRKNSSKVAHRRRRFADGGDFTSYLDSVKSRGGARVGCGLRVRINTLTMIAQKFASPGLADFLPPPLDCVVVASLASSRATLSSSSSAARACSQLLAELRLSGLRAARNTHQFLAVPRGASHVQLLKFCRECRIPFLVFVTTEGDEIEGPVKVVSTRFQDARYMERSAVLPFILSSLSDTRLSSVTKDHVTFGAGMGTGQLDGASTVTTNAAAAATGAGTANTDPSASSTSQSGSTTPGHAPSKELAFYIYSAAAFARDGSKSAKETAFREEKLVEGKISTFLASLGSSARLVLKSGHKNGHSSNAVAGRRSFSSSTSGTVIAVDAPRAVLREFSAFWSPSGIGVTEAEALERFISQHSSLRRQLRSCVSVLLGDARTDGKATAPVMLFSSVDEGFVTL